MGRTLACLCRMLVLVFVVFFVVFCMVLFSNLMAIIAIGMSPDCVFMVMLTSHKT